MRNKDGRTEEEWEERKKDRRGERERSIRGDGGEKKRRGEDKEMVERRGDERRKRRRWKRG